MTAAVGTVPVPDRLVAVPHGWRSVGEMELPEPLPLRAGRPDTVAAMALLRDCAAAALRVRWRVAAGHDLDPAPLYHLPPPAGPPGAALDRWRKAHRYGSCYYRRGPGFIQVKDSRDPGAVPVVLVADHPDLVATFLRCLDPTPVADLDQVSRDAVDLLAAERLVLVTGGLALTLPHRMRRWPVPYNAV